MKTEKLTFFEILPNKIHNIFFLLHGYGCKGDDLIPIAMQFRTFLPHCAFIFVNAPTLCDDGNGGFQWFGLKTMNLFSILKDIKGAHISLNALIQEQIVRFNVSMDNVLIGGFSQGAMMTLYTGLRLTEKAMGLLCFSGMLPDTFETLAKEIRAKPNCLLIHGTADTIVPFDSMGKTEELLKNLDVPYQAFPIENMGHEINEEAMEIATEFIQECCNKC